MADFCKQCSEEMFGRDYNDLVMTEPGDAKRLYTICEGCGFTVVDPKTGVCIGACLQKHGELACQTPTEFTKGEIPR